MEHLSTSKNKPFNESKRDFIKCRKFFDEVAELLSNEYQVVASCNRDLSAYLVPKGTKREITYQSKPACSLRVSDHWNWYSNIKKCPKRTTFNAIQLIYQNHRNEMLQEKRQIQ